MTAIGTVTVRQMADGEQGTVRALLTEAFLPYEPHFPPRLFAPYLRDLLDLTGGDPIVLVASLHDEVVGTMRVYPAGGAHRLPVPPGWAVAGAAAVQPNLRRTGVAHALLAECARRAAGATHLAFHTIDQLPDAFGLALRLGYPRRPDLDFDGGEYYGLPEGRIKVKAFGRLLA